MLPGLGKISNRHQVGKLPQDLFRSLPIRERLNPRMAIYQWEIPICAARNGWFGVGGLELAHAVAFEFDPVGVVDDAIEDGVGKSWIADDLVPAPDRQLTGDENRTGIVAVLDDLEKIAALFGIELLWSPIVENEEIDARERAQELRISSIAAGEREP
jgi:hypothetical protein